MNLLIETKRLILRKWEPADVERLIRLAGQEHIEHWMPDWKEYDRHAKGWIETVIRHYEQNNPMEGFIAWAVELKENRKLIGFVGLGEFDELGEREASLAYWLDIEHNGCGYMTEAVKAAADAAFEQYGYDYIVIAAQTGNLPSRRVAEKAGFQYIKTIEFKDSGQTEILPFCYYKKDNPRSDKRADKIKTAE